MARTRRKYIITADNDGGCRQGDVRLGGSLDEYDDTWRGGQLIFAWEQREAPMGFRPPSRVERIVQLANWALEQPGCPKP